MFSSLPNNGKKDILGVSTKSLPQKSKSRRSPHCQEISKFDDCDSKNLI